MCVESGENGRSCLQAESDHLQDEFGAQRQPTANIGKARSGLLRALALAPASTIAPNLRLAHLARMAFVMKKDEAFDPVQTCLLGADAVMLQAQPLAQLIQ